LDQKMGLKRRMISEAERPSRNKSESRPEKETEENPLIQEALRLFNGRIVKQ
jgi:hypothetical protein